MAYRTLRKGASEASMPEERAGYEDYMDTPEGRAKANLLALGMGGMGALGAKAISAAPSLSAGTLRQWLATRGARAAAPEAVLMEPAAGTAARNAIAESSVMAPRTAAATIAAGAPAAIPFVPGAGYSSAPAMTAEDIHGNIRQPITPEDIHGVLAPTLTPEDIHGNIQQAITPEDIHGRITPRKAPARPAAPAAAPAATPQQGLLSRIFSGEDYQSSNALASDPRLAGYSARVVQNGNVNWGDRDNAADFFRADKAMMAQREAAKKAEEGEGKAKGGAVAGKDAAIHKALEIIHHLLTRGH